MKGAGGALQDWDSLWIQLKVSMDFGFWISPLSFIVVPTETVDKLL